MRRSGRVRRGSAGPVADAGVVTAELAVVLPAVLLVVALGLALIGAAATRLRCADAAQVAARYAARGEPMATVVGAARRVAPEGADVEVRPTGDDLITVEVSAPVHVLGLVGWLPVLRVHEQFTEQREPSP